MFRFILNIFCGWGVFRKNLEWNSWVEEYQWDFVVYINTVPDQIENPKHDKNS